MALQIKQVLFGHWPAGKTEISQRAVGRQYPVAGDNNGNGVPPYGSSYRLHSFGTNLPGNLPIGAGSPIGNLGNGMPHFFLKWGAIKQKRQGKFLSPPFKILQNLLLDRKSTRLNSSH